MMSTGGVLEGPSYQHISSVCLRLGKNPHLDSKIEIYDPFVNSRKNGGHEAAILEMALMSRRCLAGSRLSGAVGLLYR